MRKIVSAAVLTLLVGVLSVAAPDQASGQAKKKETPPAKKGPAAKAGTIEVYDAKDGYRFRIKDQDGKTVAMPTKGSEEKDDCLKALDFVRTTLNNAKPTDVRD